VGERRILGAGRCVFAVHLADRLQDARRIEEGKLRSLPAEDCRRDEVTTYETEHVAMT
jgi:hypothetical protein